METKTFKSKYDYPIFIIEDDEIKQISMREYLETYWHDETTTPEGLANRTQVRTILVGRNGELLRYSRDEERLDPEYYKDEEDGWMPEIKYGTFTWTGAWGNGPFVWNRDKYDSREEAYETILDKFYHDFQKYSSSAPTPYMTTEEAEEALKEHLFFKEFGYFPADPKEIDEYFKNLKREEE
jgi:hypothetical protein